MKLMVLFSSFHLFTCTMDYPFILSSSSMYLSQYPCTCVLHHSMYFLAYKIFLFQDGPVDVQIPVLFLLVKLWKQGNDGPFPTPLYLLT